MTELWCEPHGQDACVVPDVMIHVHWVGALRPDRFYVACVDCANQMHDMLDDLDPAKVARLREYYWRRLS
jgi:hypothetical protein